MNDQGKLVAVYGSEAMPPERDAVEHPSPDALKIHYAPVLDPKVIELGLDRQNSEMWISLDLNKNGTEQKEER